MTAVPARCPSTEEFERLLRGELGDDDRAAIESHVNGCTPCRERLHELAPPTSHLVGEATAPNANATRAAPGPDEAFLERLRQGPVPRSDDLETTPGSGPVGPDRMSSIVGAYEIIGTLGRGGMGAVYKARHRELEKVVAVKVLPADRVDQVSVQRFRTEMKAAGRLDHPNIVAAFDAGRVGETHFLVMEFVDGLDLSHLVGRRGTLAIADACELARQAAVGLAHAHDRGLIHRDIKPSNLMLARGGVVKVLDLGLARLPAAGAADGLTNPGALLGTADYIAPEQIDRAHAADSQADIYGLGATLYFLLAGQPPFGGERFKSWLDKLRAHQVEPVPSLRERRAEIPADLASLVEQMLAKDPAGRPTAAEVAVALRPFASGADLRGLLQLAGIASDARDTDPLIETDLAKETRSGESPAGRGDRRTQVVASFAAVAGILALGIVLWPPHRPEPAPSPLEPRAPEPVRLLSMEVRHGRGHGAEPVGMIGDRNPILVGDALRLSIKFSVPAYCYLVAFNPGGQEQLCYPESQAGETAAPPVRLEEVQFPREGQNYFVLDVAGPQVFAIVGSSRPLPSYPEWRVAAGSAPWKSEIDLGGLWRFEAGTWTELVSRADLKPPSRSASRLKLPDFFKKPSGGGKVTRIDRQAPKPLQELSAYFTGRPEFDTVQLLSFPVFPPDAP